MVNGTAQDIYPKELFNRIPIRKDGSRNLRLAVTNNRLPVYGISFETDNGISVDNFSFRGITGIELNKMDTAFLDAIRKQNPYDLMIFQYGVNVLFRPNDKNFSWYGNKFQSMLVKMKKAFPDTEMMLVSAADRAFRYDGNYSSALGIDSLIKMQASIAFETGMAFYNQYETMGGKNSIVRWAAEQPSLANKDYVHPNGRGAAKLGKFLYEAFLKDYNKYQKLHPKS
jgi:lysophospholipase L1-like esterase